MPGSIPEVVLTRGVTGLMVIDMQYLDAHRNGEFGRRAKQQGIEDQVEWFFSRLETTTIPSIQELIAASRSVDVPVIYTRIASMTGNGEDLGWRYRYWGMTAGVDEQDSQILDELRPLEGDILITKTTTSAFIGSNIDSVLRRLGVEVIVACGVMTSGCVESTVRDAADSGYRVLVAEEGCAALSKQAHENSLGSMDHIFAHVRPTAEILSQLNRL